jgi:hypothetical protein
MIEDLDDLEELFGDLGFGDPTPEQIYKMYGIFLNDFVRNTLYVKGKMVRYKTNPSKHPLFRGMHDTFVHVVTRESKIRGKREFDQQRANRIHWIRPILENAKDERIWYFERQNENDENQEYYWYESQDFLVILKPIEPDVLLVTSFYVDKDKKKQLRGWYQKYKGL